MMTVVEYGCDKRALWEMKDDLLDKVENIKGKISWQQTCVVLTLWYVVLKHPAVVSQFCCILSTIMVEHLKTPHGHHKNSPFRVLDYDTQHSTPHSVTPPLRSPDENVQRVHH